MITLAEAIKLKSILRKHSAELEEEIHRVAFTQVEGNDAPKKPKRSIEVVDEQLLHIRKEIRTLDRLIYEANSVETVEIEGEYFTLVEAIEYAIQLRQHVTLYKQLAVAEEKELNYYSEDNPTYRVALFDPEHYRQEALAFERKANRLSNAVNAKNYAVEIDFDGSTYF